MIIGGGEWIQTTDPTGMSRLLYQAELRRHEKLDQEKLMTQIVRDGGEKIKYKK